jgi:4'-phosphopantetheinyl transferase
MVIPEREIHVWRVELGATAQEIAAYEATLSEDEKARAQRFHFERDQVRFVIGRGRLRELLGQVLHVVPRTIEFEVSDKGKPFLAGPLRDRVYFNVSHSGDLALIALGGTPLLGVDIETMRDIEEEEIAKRFFCAGECAKLRALQGHARREAFFRCWARKEAFMKAVGLGFSLPLEDFEVSVGPEEPAALLWLASGEAVAEWSIQDLPAIAGYKAALAVRERHPLICYFGF